MLNHEYLADEEVTRLKNNSKSYINILLNIAFRNNNPYLASSFNYSFTKKRLLMMTKNNFSKTAILKKIAVIPLFLIMGLLVINAQNPTHFESKGAPPPPPPMDPMSPLIRGNGLPPLYVVDGVIVENFDKNTINNDSIYSIGVYKESKAIEKYGKKGKDGVIEITTRKYGPQKVDKVSPSYVVMRDAPGENNENTPFVVVEEMPEFPGGESAMSSWIYKNLKYPPEARNQKLEGSVRLRFLIDKKGKIQEIVVRNSDNPLFDNEAKRIISIMPDWKPGKQGGKLVDVYKMVTIDFKLK